MSLILKLWDIGASGLEQSPNIRPSPQLWFSSALIIIKQHLTYQRKKRL